MRAEVPTRVARVTFTGVLGADQVEEQLRSATAQFDEGACGLLVDCRAMTDYTAEARRKFTSWIGQRTDAATPIAVVTDRPLWQLVVRAMRVGTGRDLRPFDRWTDAYRWLVSFPHAEPSAIAPSSAPHEVLPSSVVGSVRGRVVIALLRAARGLDAEAVSKLRLESRGELHELLASPLSSTASYPYRTVAQLLRSLDAVLGDGEGELATELGRRVAADQPFGARRSDVASLLDTCGALWRADYDFGRVELRYEPGVAALAVCEAPQLERIHLHYLAGFWAGLIARAARSPQILRVDFEASPPSVRLRWPA